MDDSKSTTARLTVAEVTDAIEAVAPLAWQESYDNAGLILGSPQQTIGKALLCTDITPDVVEEAIAEGAGLIVSHHPAIFRGLKKIDPTTPFGKMLGRSLEHGIAWYAAHTNFDNAPTGVNAYWADKLGLRNRAVLEPLPGMAAKVPEPAEGAGKTAEAPQTADSMRPAAGAGLHGSLPRSMNETELLEKLKTWSGAACIRHSGLCGRTITHVGVCGGSGAFLQAGARRAGCQVLITGEAKYHDFVEASPDLWLVELGHFESEQFTKQLFYECIKKKFPTFATRISETEHCPVCYF
ncbi:MAG: Nif3-like dinuclear metal center hexameric protein [Bacteroidales bacterium]|nr:Nif3-like dinuclear metal center hexameric protein [Bacteroidales bacterium]